MFGKTKGNLPNIGKTLPAWYGAVPMTSTPDSPATPPPRPAPTFRDAVREQAERLWRLQWVGLVAGFGGFVLVALLAMGGPSAWLPLAQVVWLVSMAIGSHAAWRGLKRVKCPRCGKQLAYLLEDKRMGVLRGTSLSGIPRGLISRHGLPDDLHACPYCHHPFDAVQDSPS